MGRRKLLTHMAVGAIAADLIAVAGFYLWLHHRYTVGIDPGFGGFALAVVGMVGAAIGCAVLMIRSPRVR